MKKRSDDLLIAIAALSVFCISKKKRGDIRAQRKMLIVLGACAYCYSRLVSEINLKRTTVLYPSQAMQELDDDTLEKMLRFWREDFSRVLSALQLTGKIILCGKERKQFKVPAFLVVLRRLAFPCTFVDRFKFLFIERQSLNI